MNDEKHAKIHKRLEDNTKAIAVFATDVGYMKKQLSDIEIKLGKLIDGVNALQTDKVSDKSRIKELERRVGSHDKTFNWLSKTVIGTVIGLIIVAIWYLINQPYDL